MFYIKVWGGLGSFWKKFQTGGWEYHDSEVLLIFYDVFVATQLHFDIISFQHFLT